MKKHLTLIFLLLFTNFLFSQKTFKANDIDVISLDTTDYGAYFFKKISKNLYKPVTYKENKKTFGLDFKIEDDYYKQKEIVEDYELTFFIDDIKPTNPKKYLKNKWLFKLKYGDEEHKNKLISAINPYIFGVHNIYFGKAKGGRGKGTIATESSDDEVKKWRSNYGDFYQTAIIKLKKGRYIYAFFNEYNDLEGFLIPTKKKDYFYYERNDFAIAKPTQKKYNINYDESLRSFNAYKLYTLQKKRNGYGLQTALKTPVIRKKYDTILYNKMYIIGKRKNKIDVYNYRLKPIQIPHLKSVYFIKSRSRWLEVLVKNEAKYIDQYAETVKKFPYQYITVCGTVSSLSAEIYKNDKTKEHNLSYSIDRFEEEGTIKTIRLKNTLKTDSITFLNKKESFFADANGVSNISEELIFKQFLRVKRNGKIGLFQLKDSVKFTKKPLKKHIKSDELYLQDSIQGIENSLKRLVEDFIIVINSREIFFYETTANITQLLPFEFDKIEYRNNLIYIEKGNKKGYLYNLTPMLFDEFEKVTKSFFSIKKNGKKGFIDVITGKEYY